MLFDTQDRIDGLVTCLQEAIEHLIATHPDAKSTLKNWISIEARKLDGLSFEEGFQRAIHFQLKDSSTIPSQRQRGRHAGINILAALNS
ncbi:hypothetical protein [Burkholderia gladioli]|uniref:hypothetical protein n=1 Tax=Burkholderia gladioli TaxID=28095 RepID=UPI00163F6144|nr:hypothetical protein [Burkholderia gladioli]